MLRPKRFRKVTPQGEALKRLRLGTALLAVGVIVVNLFGRHIGGRIDLTPGNSFTRSEEHTSELQSQSNLVCRLLLEKKKNKPRRKKAFITSRRMRAVVVS